tara:strand:+ start:699 stop:1244 length:546 start_codon:yes stop_codon:yes gene_type:complete
MGYKLTREENYGRHSQIFLSDKDETNHYRDWSTTEIVDDLFKDVDGHRVIKVEDVKELQFEFGGSPFTYGIGISSRGRLEWFNRDVVDDYDKKDYNNSNDNLVDTSNDVNYLWDISNKMTGRSLISFLEKCRFNTPHSTDYMTEDYLKMVSEIFWGTRPDDVWNEGELEYLSSSTQERELV